jgi:hypothetical protein
LGETVEVGKVVGTAVSVGTNCWDDARVQAARIDPNKTITAMLFVRKAFMVIDSLPVETFVTGLKIIFLGSVCPSTYTLIRLTGSVTGGQNDYGNNYPPTLIDRFFQSDSLPETFFV